MHAARAEHRIVRPQRRRSQPHVPVQARLHRLFPQVARPRGRSHIDDDLFDFANAPVPHQFARLAELVRGTLHRARLEYTVILARRLHHFTGLMDGQGERLLAIDILARFARRDGYEGVPVIGRRNHHGIDVLACQQFAKLLVGRAALEFLVALNAVELLDRLFAVLPTRRIDIAHGHHLRVGHRQEIIQEPSPLRARANEAQGDQVIGAFPGGVGAGGVEKQWSGERGGGSRFQELPPIQLMLHGAAHCLMPSALPQSNSSG